MNRIVSLGCHFPTFDSCDFSEKKSLTDYDVVIIDPDGITASFPRPDKQDATNFIYWKEDIHFFWELMRFRRSEINALLDNGKVIISFLAPIHDGLMQHSSKVRYSSITNYDWFEKGFGYASIIKGEGRVLKLVDNNNPFAGYYHAFKSDLYFSAYINITSDRFTGKSFITNQTNHVVGFLEKIRNGFVVFLPNFIRNEENDKKFVGVIKNILKEKFNLIIKTDSPDWINQYVVPGTDKLSEALAGIQIEIKKLESEKLKIETEREDLENFKELLYEQGHILQDKVVDAFSMMGFKAETVKIENTDFDVVLESKEGRAIGEVEGRDDSAIHKGKIDQLLSAITQDSGKTGSFAKGILIGNHYRKIKPEDRGEVFTTAVMDLAKHFNFALISTVSLYYVVIYLLEHPEDEVYKKLCREAVFNTEGVLVEFPLAK
jgi:hypothetical protein